jgi:membrane protein implicated in regulation of membrane protease activity
VIFLLAVIAKVLWVEGPWGWVLIGVAAALEVGESFLWLRWNRRRRARVGVETLEGDTAVVLSPCRPDGQVRVQGEIWAARCEEGADPGERVVVERVNGLKLTVRRTP